MNTGHYCCGTERIYVVEKVYDEFLAKVIEGTRKLRQGADLGFEEDVGAVFWDRQMSIIEDHVEDARTRGATIHVGGRRNPALKGLYYEPTVMSNVDHDMKIMQEETFGPILCVQKVRDLEEAIRLANESPYGLNGNVWTRDKKEGYDIACRIDTGAAFDLRDHADVIVDPLEVVGQRAPQVAALHAGHAAHAGRRITG